MLQAPSHQIANRILLMLCVIVCVCLLLTRHANELQYEGAGTHQEVQLPPGMRTVTVPVSDRIMQDKSLLCPGCFVDVIYTWKLNKGRVPKVIPKFIVDLLIKCKLIRNSGGMVYAALLNGIPVLSVKRGIRGTFVTLLVTTEQAEALSLAEKRGSLSVTIYNPMYRKPVRKILRPQDNRPTPI